MYRFLFSYLISAFCGWILAFLVPLTIEGLTDSAFYTAATYAVSYLPYLLVMPIGGVLADVFNKKRMMQFLELANVLFTGFLIMAIFILRHVGLILLAHFMLCAVVAVQHPVFQGMIPAIVSSEKAKNFHAYTGIMTHVIALAAPGLTGLLLMYFDKKMLFYGLGCGYLLGFVLISWVSYPHHHLKKEWGFRAIVKGLKEAFVYVLHEPFFKYTIILGVFSCFSQSFISSNLIHYLKHHHGMSGEYISYCYIPMGLGSIIGSMLATYIVGRLPSAKVLLYSSTLEVITIGLLLVSSHVGLFIGLRSLRNMLISIYIVAYFTHRQKIVAPHLLSRTVAVTRMLAWTPIPLASLSSGFLFEKTQSFQYLIIASGLSLSLGLLLSWRGLMHAASKGEEEAAVCV